MAKFLKAGKKMRMRNLIISLITVLMLSNCASYDFSRRVVQQGNLLPQAKIERLRLGMGKNDVAILMGTSLLSPTFNNQRWDYAYSIRRGNGPLEIRNVSLYFAGERLTRVEHRP
ncbi:MAG: outer membrane protein assembly factor BamE [Proteobacteria bacterium]|nr:outer membrane protein assembly factor BamE [Pseudomonadota bacterium]